MSAKHAAPWNRTLMALGITGFLLIVGVPVWMASCVSAQTDAPLTATEFAPRPVADGDKGSAPASDGGEGPTAPGASNPSSRASQESTPILHLPVYATLHSPVLLPDVLLQLRDTAPLRPDGSDAGYYVRRNAGETLHLYVIRPGEPRMVTGLNDLRGLVSLNTPEKAMEFVRLRTNPDIRHLLTASYPSEAEILPRTSARALPKYGVGVDPFDKYSVSLPGELNSESQVFGYYGVLREEAFRQGGFTPPKIRALPHHGGYQIERWMYTRVRIADSPTQVPNEDDPRFSDIVYQIRETVARDGAYTRERLAVRPAPVLPLTSWQFFQGFY